MPYRPPPPRAHVIRNAAGLVHSWSQNLTGLRREVGRRLVRVVSIEQTDRYYGGRLMVLFEDGLNYEGTWADFGILCELLRNWRNMHGAPLQMHRRPAGMVGYRNPWLQAASKWHACRRVFGGRVHWVVYTGRTYRQRPR